MGRERTELPLERASPVPGPPRWIRFGIFEVDLREHRLTRSGHLIAIQEQPFRLLVSEAGFCGYEVNPRRLCADERLATG